MIAGELGDEWRAQLDNFDEEPLAAASIGQVHRARVAASHPDAPGAEVCMKIQYPGVARSIHSDIDNLMRLVRRCRLTPPSG